MQTLTRLLARLWDALFPAQRPPMDSPAARIKGHQSNSGRPSFSDCAKSPHSSQVDWQIPNGRRTKQLTSCQDSDDISFCTWMYYLN